MNREDKQGLAIIAGLVILGISAFALTYSLKPKSYEMDEDSLCQKNVPIVLKKIVLIDKSDKWDADNIAKMNRWLSSIDEGVPMGSRLNIATLSGSKKEGTRFKTVFDKCSPGKESDCNALYENCRDIRRYYNFAFEEPLDEIRTLLEKPESAQTSPLLETMTEIIDDIESQEAEIHIVSDLMENGYKFNFYKGVAKAEKMIKEYPIASNVNVKVYLHIIERRKHSRELLDAVKQVWVDYFRKQGIRVKVAKRFFIAS